MLLKVDLKMLCLFEVVGVLIDKFGFYVFEFVLFVFGCLLFVKLLSMYVCIIVFVMNFGVYLKQGCENNFVWVMMFDKGKLVLNVQICVLDCNGDEIVVGKIDV